MSRKQDYFDDGRTIVDMSGIEPMPLLFPKPRKPHGMKAVLDSEASRVSKEPEASQETPETPENDRPWEINKNDLSKEEKRAYYAGTLSAALLVGGAFALVFFIVILLMVLFL